jgi:hypothetical protein
VAAPVNSWAASRGGGAGAEKQSGLGLQRPVERRVPGWAAA